MKLTPQMIYWNARMKESILEDKKKKLQKDIDVIEDDVLIV